MVRRIVVGMSGSSGAIYGVRLLQVLRDLGVETHLVLSEGAARTLTLETPWSAEDVRRLAHAVYDDGDLAAAVSSGSFPTDGMVVVPCSIKTLSAVANSYNATLLARAADVTLKERRRLVLVVRETPLHLGHLRLMAAVTEMGGVVLPPIPAFYHRPRTVQDIVDHTVGKVLDQFGLDARLFRRWTGAGTADSAADLADEVARFLDEHTVLSLATADRDGRPWSAPVYYARAGRSLYFVSPVSTRHAADIAARGRAAGSVYDDATGWRTIRGVQLEGRVAAVPPEEVPTARQCYVARFPFTAAMVAPDGAFVVAGRRIDAAFYRFDVEHCLWIDNAAGFGRRRPVELR
ncbi:MAG: UbiX family flavin prenyltransferase [Clostridia bacterium]|nr:UbiX family flavin prenyltransferase [Clostridia bacterium]